MPVKKKKRRKTKKKIKQLKKFDIKKFIKKNTVPIIAVVVALAVLIVCTVIGSSGRKLPNPLPYLNKDVALGVDVSEICYRFKIFRQFKQKADLGDFGEGI